MKNKEERLEYIDIAKGIAILLVVVGHTVRRGNPVSEDIVRGLIFSFHMPLFFVMSAITTRLSQDPYQLLKRTEKSFIRLIVPAISVYLLLQVIGIIRYGITGSRKAYLVLESGDFNHSESGEIRQSESINKNQSPGLYLLK